MSAFRPKGRTKFSVKVPTSKGWVNRPTETRDPNTARKMQRMVTDLSPDELGASDVLDRLGARTLTVRALWAMWCQSEGSAAQKLKAIRAQLADSDLLAKRKGWFSEVETSSSLDTAEHYDKAVDSLVEVVGVDGTLPRSRITVDALKTWLASLPGKTGTKRKKHAGVSSFFKYCVSVGVLDTNPMRDVPRPPAGNARDRHLSTVEARQLADAQPSPFREFSALLAGTGIEVGVALGLKVKDVDVAHQEIRARGTKTHSRDRVAKVASWAWPDVQRAIQGKTPEALLFDTIRVKYDTYTAHNAACLALGIKDYTMRDARHTYAVRMVKAGTPLLQVGKQLGHASVEMTATVYGLYEPSQAEREHWEKVATARDAEIATKTKEAGK